MTESDLSTPHDDSDSDAELIVRYFENVLSEGDAAQLRLRLKRDAACRALFVSFAIQRCAIVRLNARDLGVENCDLDEVEAEAESFSRLSDAMILPALRDDPAPEEEPARPVPSWENARQGASRRRYRAPRGFWGAAAALVLVGAGLWISQSVSHDRSGVATLARVADPHWAGEAAPRAGTHLQPGQSFKLSSGCVELAFAGGGRVIVEGPAQFKIDSPAAMSLSAGKLSARVEGGGFVVTIPTATITDLGTEFAIRLDESGATEVAVFKGRVAAALSSPPTGEGGSRVLAAGEAALISDKAIALDPAGAVPQQFVRSLGDGATSLDLVDIFAGGDGLTHRRGLAIDPSNGRAGQLAQRGGYSGNYVYHRIPLLPLLDGGFVPDGLRGPMQVDSAGHAFAFPVTTNSSYNLIFAGGAIPAEGWDVTSMATVLGGVDYAQSGHGLLAMHANKGITIDLAQIRRLHPGRSVSRFVCVTGSTWTPAPGDADPIHRADVFVLVDGQSRFEKRGLTHLDGALGIDVPLGDADHFLTLATTDGGDGISADGIIIGDPMIELGSR